jgi:hypothetical protein
MPWFGPRPLPLTSYGFQPPPGATAHGWKCTNYDCGRTEYEPVRRWPVCCRSCGSPADPLLDKPWAHEAEGVELNWQVIHHPERGGGTTQERLMCWNLKDALLRRDIPGAQVARATIRRHAGKRALEDLCWSPSYVFCVAVLDAMAVGDMDGAADDLCFWLSISSGDNAEDDNRNRTNSRTAIETSMKFIAAPGGISHRRAPEIRQGCLSLAEGAFTVLNRDQQAAITQMART